MVGRSISTTKRILIVDDDPAVLRHLHRVVCQAGFDAVAAASGQEALGRLQRASFDLLITDLYMPDVDGFDLLVSARVAQVFLPVIVMSGGYDSLNMVRAVTSLGAVHALTKPFSVRQFLDTIVAIVGAPAPPASTEPTLTPIGPRPPAIEPTSS